MKSLLLAALAVPLITPISNAQKLWRQTEYSIYDISNPNSPFPTDSTVYFYNPYYASLPTWDPVKGLIYDPYVEHFKCDSSVRYTYVQVWQSWYKDKVEIQSFDTKGNVTGRIRKRSPKFKAEPENHEGDHYTYDALGNVETFARVNWANNQWNNVFRENYTYASGTLTNTQADTCIAGQWQSNWKRDYTYTNAKLSEETLSRWMAGSWSSSSRIIYNYDITGRLAEKISQAWNTTNSAWVNVTRNAYTYNISDCLADTGQKWNSSGWQTTSQRIYQYDINNKPTSATWVNWRKHNYTYNAEGLISHEESLYWQDWMNSWEYDQYSRAWNYYYQQFTVGIPEIAQTENNLTLYPNPAITQLHINATWKNAQPFTVAILDMSGRVLKQWSEAATKTYSSTIPVMDMPAGNYTIVLSNGEQKISKRFSVLK